MKMMVTKLNFKLSSAVQKVKLIILLTHVNNLGKQLEFQPTEVSL